MSVAGDSGAAGRLQLPACPFAVLIRPAAWLFVWTIVAGVSRGGDKGQDETDEKQTGEMLLEDFL